MTWATRLAPFSHEAPLGAVTPLEASLHEGVVAETIRVPGGWVLRTLRWPATEAEGPCAVAQSFIPL